MASRYAVLMATLGMVVVLIRSLRSGVSFDSAMVQAGCWMGLLGVVGLVVGAIATATIDESVRRQMEQQLAMMQTEAESSAQLAKNAAATTV